MRPGNDAIRREIVGIGQDLPDRRLRILDPIGDPVSFGVGDRLRLGVELQPDLRLHVARTRPAHQRLDHARRFGLVFQDPLVFPLARLGGGAGGLIDSSCHRRPLAMAIRRWSGQQDSNLRPEVPKTVLSAFPTFPSFSYFALAVEKPHVSLSLPFPALYKLSGLVVTRWSQIRRARGRQWP